MSDDRINMHKVTRYHAPATPDGRPTRVPMVKSLSGTYVEFTVLQDMNKKLAATELQLKRANAEAKRLREVIETRDLLEVAVMKMTTALVEAALTPDPETGLRSIARTKAAA